MNGESIMNSISKRYVGLAALTLSVLGCSSSPTNELISRPNREPASSEPNESVLVFLDSKESETRAVVMHTELSPYRFTVLTCSARALAQNSVNDLSGMVANGQCHEEVVLQSPKEVSGLIEKIADYGQMNQNQETLSTGYFIASTIGAAATLYSAAHYLWFYSGTADIAPFLARLSENLEYKFRGAQDFKLIGGKEIWDLTLKSESYKTYFRVFGSDYISFIARTGTEVTKAKIAITALEVGNRLALPAMVAAVGYGFYKWYQTSRSSGGAKDALVVVGTTETFLKDRGVEHPPQISYKKMAMIFRNAKIAPAFGTTPIKSPEN
jgi:hypothetical protein